MVHGIDVEGTFGGDGIGGGKAVKIDKRDVLFIIARVKIDVLEPSLVVKSRYVIIESGGVRL